MKKIFLSITVIILIASFNERPIRYVNASVTLEARDCEYIANYISFNSTYETMFDSTKGHFRVPSPPTGTTTVQIDSVPVTEWVQLNIQLRNDGIAVRAGVFDRVDSSMRAISNTELTAELDALDDIATNTFIGFRQRGRNILRKQ